MTQRIIGLDPGNENTGMAIIDDGLIVGAYNLSNDVLFDKICSWSIHRGLTIVIEDIKPFSLQLTPQVIDTCKFIGVLVYRLETHAGLKIKMVSRYDVKRWVFDYFKEVSLPLVEAKIEKKLFSACNVETKEEIKVQSDGKSRRKGSFIYVDDNIVKEAMKAMYFIKTPPPGKGYEHGLQTHSFQALACASYFMTNR